MKKSLEKTIYVLTPLFIFILINSLLGFIDRVILGVVSAASVEAENFIVIHGAKITIILAMINVIIEIFALIKTMRFDSSEFSIADYLNMNGMSFYRMDRFHSYPFSFVLLGIQGACGALGINILLSLTGIIEYDTADYVQATSNLYMVPMWMGLIYVVLFSPAIEELLYRLIIYGRLKRSFPIWLAVILSALFFGVMHGNLVQGIYAFLMGILMCLGCEYTHSILGSFIMHALANMIIYVLSSRGILIKLNNVFSCVIFLGIMVLTILFEVVYAIKSKKKFGKIEGVVPVGCFYIDDSNEG